ncbi:four-carbon acid sugar kinase family protein [Roseomonas nepalensis]|uniref:Four-carbon acid sugar kinase family protein n=1 Tax=Muricoccus nepalensis TaxID=1854500 RepID=A0A502GCJ4_9PROT|nr:four-carbon acid sugar kinase family protein [Roseomonas nepalensis]TPG59574.1 four-carbon acid sugar kinase family protein [Roseomonas nepalensis]
MAQLGCLAESLAVALEVGAALSAEGMDTALVLGTPSAPLPEAEAVVIVAPGDGIAACDALLAAGARQVLQAIAADFEPLATGRLADALLRRLQASFAPLAPSDPARGRSVYLGHLFLGASPAGGEANLPRRLSAGTEEPAGLIPFRVVEAGAGAIRAEMSRLAEWGRRYAVVDAITGEHLDALGEAARAQPLLIGGAGLAAAAARQLPRGGAIVSPPCGPGAVLSASPARETLSQAGLARLYAPTFDLRDAEGAAAALEWAAPRLSDDTPVVIAALPPAMPALGALAQGLVARGVTRLLVAGEEACEAVVAALGPPVLRMGAEADPGIAWCAAEGGALHLLLKPGTAGARDLLLRAFAPPA